MSIRAFAAAFVVVVLVGCTPEKAHEPDPSQATRPSTSANAPVRPPVPQAAPESAATPAATPLAIQEVFPGVRLSLGVVLVDGKVAADTSAFANKIVYLEVIACRPDSREHEALVVTPVLPSHLHAALLLAGASSGKPGSWRFDGKDLVADPPTGDRVFVSLRWKNVAGEPVERSVADLVRSTRGVSLGSTPDGFVFAGSGFLKQQGGEKYAADVSGTLIGLCTFGDEPIAWSRVISPEAEIEEPQWAADGTRLPPPGTPVTIVIRLRAI